MFNECLVNKLNLPERVSIFDIKIISYFELAFLESDFFSLSLLLRSLVLLGLDDGVELFPWFDSDALIDESEFGDGLEGFVLVGDVAKAARGSNGFVEVDDDTGLTDNVDAGTLDGNFLFNSFFEDLT